jgi:hypothetical protein
MRFHTIRWALLPLGLVLFGGEAAAQEAEPEARQEAASSTLPNVFFDCNGRNCDSQYFRTEIDWVNWVRDRKDSDVHLLMTNQATGAGGREYQLDFIGVGEQESYEDQLRFQTLPTDTDREALDGIANAIGIGLARFSNEAGFRDIVRLAGAQPPGIDPAERVVSAQEVDDPWNLWVFRVNGSANLDGEETRSTKRVNGSFSAARVSPTWKLNFSGNVNYNRRQIELTDEPDFIDTRTDWGLTQLVVYSIADHWSVGFQSEARRIVSFNQAFRVEFTPAVEYSFFPYEEATRQALTAFYKIGPAYRDYLDTTAFGEDSELRFEQSLELEFSQRQAWGDASIRVTGSHFLHDTGLYNLSLRGDVEFRIVRGFSVNARGNIAWVKDQIYLAGRGASTAEELLNLVRRAQDFNYGIQIGFSIQFGSIFNNVVNNRFSGASGGGDFFGGMMGGRRR